MGTGYKKQELWLSLIQKVKGSEVARTQPFRVTPDTTIGEISTVEETLKNMSGPDVSWDYEHEWRDVKPNKPELVHGYEGRGSKQ
jgi:hypothetical protein